MRLESEIRAKVESLDKEIIAIEKEMKVPGADAHACRLYILSLEMRKAAHLWDLGE